MKQRQYLTKDEKSLLLFAECACVDYGGVYQPQRLNDDDRRILDKWKSDGFCDHGRVASDYLTPTRCVWVKLSDEAMQMAHQLRMERSKRMWDNRDWITTDEKNHNTNTDDIDSENPILEGWSNPSDIPYIVKGVTVWLRSGSPPMTVVGVCGKRAIVKWGSGKKCLGETARFRVECLTTEPTPIHK